MASVDEILAMAAQESGVSTLPVAAPINPEPQPGYSLKQLAFDIPVATAKAGAGLADILSYPFVKGLQYAGVPAETFGTTKLIEAGMKPVAQEYGVRPETEAQKFIEFVAPSPISKGKLLADAVTGGLGYVGSKIGEVVAPDSPATQLLLSLGLPIAAQKTAAKTLTEGGKSLQRQSFQYKKADLTAERNALVEMPDGEEVTQLTKSLNNLIQNNVLGTSRNPKTLKTNIDTASQAVEDQIQSVLKTAEQQVGPVPPPAFDRAQKYVTEGNVPANEMDAYWKEIADLQSGIAQAGAGSLTFLNKQRKSIGESWKNKSTSDAGFWREVYRDIKEHIEKYAPEVQDLNKQKQDLVVVKPVVTQAAKASEKGISLKDAVRFFGYTTGGGAIPFLAGAAGSVPIGAVLGAGLGLASTPTGQQITGKALQTLGETPTSTLALGLAGKIIPSGIETPPIQQNTTSRNITDEQRQRLQKLLSSLESSSVASEMQTNKVPESVKVGKQNISIPQGEKFAPPTLVKAVMQVESAGKPKAVSPKGAAGLMQLMPGTAKDLGVTDRFDPQQNVEGGSKYLQQQLAKFGDSKLALAAYNWGPDNVSKAIKRLEAQDIAPTWDNIKKSAPTETKQYVDTVTYLQKYDDFDLAKIAAKVGSARLDSVLKKYKTGKKFTVGNVLDDLGLTTSDVKVKRSNVLSAASNLIEA